MSPKEESKQSPTNFFGRTVSEQAARKWIAPVLEALGCCYSCEGQRNGLKLVPTDGTGAEVTIQVYDTGVIVPQGRESPLLEVIQAVVKYKFKILGRGKVV